MDTTFEFVTPTAEQSDRIQDLCEAFNATVTVVRNVCLDDANRTVALGKLREAFYWTLDSVVNPSCCNKITPCSGSNGKDIKSPTFPYSA